MKDQRKIFGQRLGEVRKERGLSLKELANQVSLSESTISRYERGTIDAKHPTIILLAQKLGVNPVWLLGYPKAEKYLPTLADNDVVQVPILKRIIRTGRTVIMSEEFIVGYEYAPVDTRVDFCLVVQGDHMINARIFDGDIVCACKQSKVNNGEVAIVLVPDANDAVIRRVYYTGGRLILRSENPQYPDMVFAGSEKSKVEIIGKVIYLRTEVR